MSVLLVCTGNICRSPTAELMLRQHLDFSSAIFSSAGTASTPGQPMHPRAIAAAGKLGFFEQEMHESRQLERDLISRSTLVLAMARDHRAAILRLMPSASRKVFTLREFAMLVRSSALSESNALEVHVNEFPPTLVEQIASRRGQVTPVAPADNDIIDPIGLDEEAFTESAAQIFAAVELIRAGLQHAN
jgi:protein-tyrosine phosphatase